MSGPKPAKAGARPLDGKALAQKMLGGLPPRIAAVTDSRGEPPLLAILSVGGDATSESYLKNKLHACRSVGIETTVQPMPQSATESEAFKVLEDLALDLQIDGILIEVPLPAGLEARRLFDKIPADKDVEGVTSVNYGRLFSAKSLAELEASDILMPCTAGAIIALLGESGVDPRGKEAVVVGRSNIVGRPVAHLLSCMDATVTLCHSKTADLERHLKTADIVVSAVGKAGLIKGGALKRGAVVLDAGMTFNAESLSGDVDYATASKAAGWLTPVPGGVGPVTIATLLANTVLAAERRTKQRLG